MRRLRELSRLIVLGLAACSAVSVRPDQADAAALPRANLTDADRQLLAEQVQQAMDAVVRRRYAEADKLAQAALAIDPRSARARAVRGMVLLQQAAQQDPPTLHQLHAGEHEIELAHQLAPGDAFVGWMRAVFFAETGHMSAAAAAAEEAVAEAGQAPPEERAALLGIAGTYRYELGEERAAIAHLQEYVALRPDDATAHFRLGACLLRVAELPLGPPPASLQTARRRAESAAAAFARCFELASGDQDAALAVAAALLRAAELAGEAGDGADSDELRRAAAAHLAALAERFPTNAEAPFRLGVIAAITGQPERARAAYTAALERDPAHVGSAMNLAALLDQAGDRAAAQELLQGLLRRDRARSLLSRDERRRIEQWLAKSDVEPAK